MSKRYYPEVHFPSQDFGDAEEAIAFFKRVHGDKLLAVVCSDETEVVWESDKLPAEREP